MFLVLEYYSRNTFISAIKLFESSICVCECVCVYFCKDNWKVWLETEIDAYFLLNTSKCLPATSFIYFRMVIAIERVFWPNIGLVFGRKILFLSQATPQYNRTPIVFINILAAVLFKCSSSLFLMQSKQTNKQFAESFSFFSRVLFCG